MLFICAAARAQDADTIVLKDDSRKFTILSQIEDAHERADFLKVLAESDPARRCELASGFVRKYPQSWLLAQAYDVSARALIDLGKNSEGLEAARFSLRLIPENPSLLILVANLEAQNQQAERALRHASAALEYLDEIERQANLNQKEWDALRPQMKASAYFARARAEIKNSPAALEDLDKSVSWNAEDAEATYLRAIVELRMAKTEEALADLAFVDKQSDAWRGRAERVLSVLAKQRGESMESLVTKARSRTVDVALRQERPPQVSEQALASGYAGPEACRACHEKEWAAWRQTGMAKMLQPYRPETLIGDFSTKAETGSAEIRVGIDKRPYFEVASANGRWQRFPVDFTIGSKWQQGYATKLPDGRLQVLPVEYNVLQKKWINYWEMIDPPGSARAVIADFPKLREATSYQQNCAICHTSQLRIEPKSGSPLEHARYLEPGIDCEMCHGPAAWHTKRAAKGKSQHASATEPPFDFKQASNRDAVRVCAQCHRQSAVRQIGEGGELNYSTRANFVPATWMRPYDAFSRKAFYKDGRFRETTFIVEAFIRSACYLRGTTQCASCHSPHLGNFSQNQTSLKYWDNPNEMCLTCHTQYRNKIAEHTRHKAQSAGSECVSCHMPKIMNAVLFQARSHQIEVPTADLTERFGQAESPNACLLCHGDKSAQWAGEQLALWRH